MTLSLESLDYPQLVCRCHSGENSAVVDYLSQAFIGDGIKFSTCENKTSLLHNAHLPCDGGGSQLMVACYHHSPYACPLTLTDCRSSFGARRILHAHQPEKDSSPLLCLTECKHTQSLSRKGIALPQNSRLFSTAERLYARRSKRGSAFIYYDISASLFVGNDPPCLVTANHCH